MSNDKIRESFEEAYQDACLSRPSPRFDPAVFTKDSSENYVIPSVQSAWWAWQTSRAAIEVELPMRKRIFEKDWLDWDCFSADEVVSAIESIGLRIKP